MREARKKQGKCSRSAFRAFDTSLPIVQSHDGFHDGKAQAGRCVRCTSGSVNPIEPIEYLRQVLSRNSRAGIGYRYHAFSIFVLFSVYDDVAAARRVSNGVRNQIAYGPSKQQRISQNRSRRISDDFGPCFIRHSFEIFCYPLKFNLHRDNILLKGNLRIVGTRQKQEIFDHSGQPFALLHIRSKQCFVLRWRTRLSERYLRLYHQIVYSGPQVMRNVQMKTG